MSASRSCSASRARAGRRRWRCGGAGWRSSAVDRDEGLDADELPSRGRRRPARRGRGGRARRCRRAREEPRASRARRRSSRRRGRAGLPVWSEIELGARLFPANPIVGVTGTNGKTTTTELLGAIFRAGRRPVEVAGNVGTPVSGLDPAAGAWLVLELSSFQLEDVHELRPRVAVLLNLEPDHLDRHGDARGVPRRQAAALRAPARRTTRPCVPRGFGAVPGAARRVEFAATTRCRRSRGSPGRTTARTRPPRPPPRARPGSATTRSRRRCARFPGVPHRLELVGERGGVRFVNDSKATNTAAARRALAAFDAPLHLILGGSRQGRVVRRLRCGRRRRRTSRGRVPDRRDGARSSRTRSRPPDVAVRHCGTLDGRRARGGRALPAPGEVVLLSPACASYDQFANFEERGDAFRALVAGSAESAWS